MFHWTKTHGCNCTPIPHGGEKYILLVGDMWYGVVETTHNPYNEKDIGWSAGLYRDGKMVRGSSGGGMTRDEGMTQVEEMIKEYIAQMMNAHNTPVGQREIYDSLVDFERDENGNLTGKILRTKLS